VQLKTIKSFIGPSIHGARPGLVVNITPPASIPFEIAALPDACRAALANLPERLRFGSEALDTIVKAHNIGELWIALALHLQRHCGARVAHGRLIDREPSGRCSLFFECETADVGIQAGGLAGALIIDLLSHGGLSPPDQDFDADRRLKELISFAKKHGLKGDSRYLMKEARVRGFPAMHLGDRWLQLGHGRYRRILRGTITDGTPWTAVEHSTDKAFTNRMLRGLGLLVPAQHVVATREQAIEAAQAIGYPVVVKPNKHDRQVGISVDIENQGEFAKAFDRARKYGGAILVEEMLKGQNYRALVIGGAIVSAVVRRHAHVVGDGENTVAELVDRMNRDPRRGVVGNTPLSTFELNAEADANLAALGYGRDSVPEGGERVNLRYLPNVSSGGTAEDVTDELHPAIREAFLLSVRALGLDVAGVDYITPDISMPPAEAGGGFCEINCSPALFMHYATAPRDIAKPLFNMLFAGGRPRHVAIVAICAKDGTRQVHELVEQALAASGHAVGSATREGLRVAGRQLSDSDSTGPMGARTLLQDPRVEALVVETPIDVVVEHGLGIDACDVVVIDDARAGGAGEFPVTTIQALKMLVRLARRALVIDVEHPLRGGLTERRDARDVILISMRPDVADLDRHVSRGGTAIALDGEADPPSFTVIAGGRPDRRIRCPVSDKSGDHEASCRASLLAFASTHAMDISAGS
jgi:cyanophycin synthetase